ncbi:MAG: helix-turn-helix domain-containing protein, partial [Gammaproteobacteria bacterium]|nr:helix-turn-helix domain-containing protein [Gammaproteobacteria bacterium]
MERKPTPPSRGNFERIARAIEFISRHAVDQPSLARIAEQAGMSEYHFARVFRRWAGISPKQLVQRLSLEAAKRSLHGEASVLQAALDAGLSGPGRLHDLFVVLEAVTPGEFKARGKGLTIRYGSADTPFGRAVIALTARGVAFLGFSDDSRDPEGWGEFRRAWVNATWIVDDASARSVAAAVWDAAGRESRRLKLWVHGSNFQIQVWQALLR